MRNALADGELNAYIRAASGNLERLIEREAWRQSSLRNPWTLEMWRTTS